ncbi:AEC family transporter [Paracoccus tegillarcae]|uniref:Malate transporter n=1 Tax=Paracoccus tegillarcae TaxID=1529068 RepID=A0A2K9EEK3_9RHOB|nr:AEC family transporter [Paracoccus tegillarcae]AUH33388.1 malate transporter [Paracoccus tegillarcae]
MLAIFLKTLPFFLLIGTGWLAVRLRILPTEAAGWLTKFVFYFALSAMLFRFSSQLDLAQLFDPRFVAAYLSGSILIWTLGMVVAYRRGLALDEMAIEAQCCMIGNTGFLGVPMLLVLLGEPAVGPVLLVLSMDTIIFSSLITLVIGIGRQGRFRLSVIGPALRGVAANPMVVSMLAGLAWGWFNLPMPEALDEYLSILGAAATPGALFAIGASLTGIQLRRTGPALWLSFAKLFLHPLAVGIAALFIFRVEPFSAGVMIAAAALPVAGNVYILAQYFNVGVQRVSSAILISTAVSIVTIPVVIHWITQG